MIQIHIDSGTYDEINWDIKVSFEAQLGLIGGTLGLFSGFSILSIIEIVYYAVRMFMSVTDTRVAFKERREKVSISQ